MEGGNAATDFLKKNKNNLVFGLSALLILFSIILVVRADSMTAGLLFANTVFTLLASATIFTTVALDWKENM